MNGQEVGTLPEVLEGTTHIEGFEQNGLKSWQSYSSTVR